MGQCDAIRNGYSTRVEDSALSRPSRTSPPLAGSRRSGVITSRLSLVSLSHRLSSRSSLASARLSSAAEASAPPSSLSHHLSSLVPLLTRLPLLRSARVARLSSPSRRPPAASTSLSSLLSLSSLSHPSSLSRLTSARVGDEGCRKRVDGGRFAGGVGGAGGCEEGGERLRREQTTSGQLLERVTAPPPKSEDIGSPPPADARRMHKRRMKRCMRCAQGGMHKDASHAVGKMHKACRLRPSSSSCPCPSWPSLPGLAHRSCSSPTR